MRSMNIGDLNISSFLVPLYFHRHVELPEEMGYRCRDLMEEVSSKQE